MLTKAKALELFREMKLGPCRERYGDIGCYHVVFENRLWFVWVDFSDGRVIDVTYSF